MHFCSEKKEVKFGKPFSSAGVKTEQLHVAES